MSSTWREERRKDRAAEAEQARQDAKAVAEAEVIRASAVAEANRAAAEQAHELQRQRAAERNAAKEARRARLRTTGTAVRAWAGEHLVDLLIYPLALVSAVMAIPAMADYGHHVYGAVTGYALPVISELGMWAFALAVQITRHRHPERPVWALQLGVWTFAAVAFGLNAIHGAQRGLSAAVVMGMASVAGVVAHQLVTAAPRRSRAERDRTRIERAAARKVTRIRRAAVRQAVAQIDADGQAHLVYAPGRYVLAGRRGQHLEAAIVPGLPIDTTTDLDGWDRELADLIATDRPAVDLGSTVADCIADASTDPGPIATLDKDADQQKSTPDRPKVGGRPGRSIARLRAELRAAIEANPDTVDPGSAESIRKALRCSPARARQLRDEYRNNPNRGQ
jgi:hypothetical protein